MYCRHSKLNRLHVDFEVVLPSQSVSNGSAQLISSRISLCIRVLRLRLLVPLSWRGMDGLMVLWILSVRRNFEDPQSWNLYSFFRMLHDFLCCLSVSVLVRLRCWIANDLICPCSHHTRSMPQRRFVDQFSFPVKESTAIHCLFFGRESLCLVRPRQSMFAIGLLPVPASLLQNERNDSNTWAATPSGLSCEFVRRVKSFWIPFQVFLSGSRSIFAFARLFLRDILIESQSISFLSCALTLATSQSKWLELLFWVVLSCLTSLPYCLVEA